MSEYKKQLPFINDATRPHWEAAKRHELVLQKCLDCGQVRPYPPAKLCPKCQSENFEWAKMSGKGKIYTYTVIHRADAEGWKDEVPYAIVTADLDEGVRMETNTLGVKPEDLKVGLPVEVVFDDVTDEVTIPKFALAKP